MEPHEIDVSITEFTFLHNNAIHASRMIPVHKTKFIMLTVVVHPTFFPSLEIRLKVRVNKRYVSSCTRTCGCQTV